MRFGLIGNPENRRVSHFVEACRAKGLSEPHVLAWERVCREPEALDDFASSIDLLRIDSPGENEAVATHLIHLGGGPERPGVQFGEIAYLKEYHLGFCQLLDRIAGLPVPFLSAPAEIKVMFDKWQSHLRFAEAGVQRPRARRAPGSYEEFRAGAGNSGRVFLKPLHGSSASGVCAVRWSAGRYQLFAPIEIDRRSGLPRLFNSLRVRRYESDLDIRTILDRLLPTGMIEEQWIAKAPFDGGRFDLRVLVIEGMARHRVVRQSNHPMTNLHLGSRRGDLGMVQAAYGIEAIEGCLRLAEQAAACFPGSLYAGVDILMNARGEAYVGEINAFGDLLPGLVHSDESAYEAIASAGKRRVAERSLAAEFPRDEETKSKDPAPMQSD